MGAHTGRTIMFRDLRALLASCNKESILQDYKDAIMMENVLLKPTGSARKEAFRRLKQLYSLDNQILIFRAMQLLWDQDLEAQPMLAFLCAIARDPMLRVTVETVINLPADTNMAAPDFARVIHEIYPDRLNSKTLASAGRNLASSWTQSGHFTGSTGKIRKMVRPSPIITTYALFLTYLCDIRGEALFDSPWTGLLDTPKHILYEQAQQASKQGWLEYRHSGTITEITFRHLLREFIPSGKDQE